MFGVEDSDPLTEEDLEELREDVMADFVLRRRRALTSIAIFAATCASVIPFGVGHALHAYWDKIGKYLVLVAMALLLWVVNANAMWWFSWRLLAKMRRGEVHYISDISDT